MDQPKAKLTPVQLALILSVFVLLIFLAYLAVSSTPVRLNLDDGIIHARLAQNLADFGKLGLNPSENGGGSSSIIWTLLISLFTFLGSKAHIAGLLLAMAGWIASCVAFAGFATAYFERNQARFAVVLLCLSGQLAANAFSGMETHLYLALTFLSLYYFHRRRNFSLFTSLAFLILTRPEGLLTAVAIAFVWTVSGRKHADTGIRAELPAVTGMLLISILSFVLSLLLLEWLGGAAPVTLTARRWLIGLPPSPLESISLTSQVALHYLNESAIRLADFVGPGHGFGIIWAVAVLLLGAWGMLSAFRTNRTGRLIALLFLLHLSFYSLILPTPGQLGRYASLLIALGIVLAVHGWSNLCATLIRFRFQKAIPWIGAVLILGYLPQLLRWPVWNRDAIHHLETVHRVMADYLRTNVPEDEPIAVFDVGMISHYSQRRVIDLGGLTNVAVLRHLQRGSVEPVLDSLRVKWIVLPETVGSNRFMYGSRLGLNPSKLQEVYSIGVSTTNYDYLRATKVAMPVQTLYRRESDNP